MKLSNVRFLYKANIKGNKKSKIVLALMAIFAISLTLVSSFSATVDRAVNDYKNDFRARALEVDPWSKELDEDTLNSIRQIKHVEGIYELKGLRNHEFSILDMKENNKTDEKFMKQYKEDGDWISVWSLIGDEKRNVIAGKSLDESPTFSCIVPSMFYCFGGSEELNDNSFKDLPYMNGEDLLGKTITIEVPEVAGDKYLYDQYNMVETTDAMQGTEDLLLPAVKYKLKVVGVYYAAPADFGNYYKLYVSEETGYQMEKQAIDKSQISEKNPAMIWWNTPSLHTHYVVADDVENLKYVYNKISEMGVDCADADDAEMGLLPGVANVSKVLSIAGTFLIFATAFLCLVNIIISSLNSVRKRKGEIGLLKAIGYSNSQISLCMIMEQIVITVKGFIIGGAISGVFVFVSNIINNHREFEDRLYIVSWQDFFVYLGIAFVFAIVVPLICQLITINKLGKIQPKDAMAVE